MALEWGSGALGTDQFTAWDDHDSAHSDAPMPYVSQAKINNVAYQHRERIEGFGGRRRHDDSLFSNQDNLILFLIILTCVMCAVTLLRLSDIHAMIQQLAAAGRLGALDG